MPAAVRMAMMTPMRDSPARAPAATELVEPSMSPAEEDGPVVAASRRRATPAASAPMAAHADSETGVKKAIPSAVGEGT